MKNLNIMLKPASSLCNLRCKYCFYADVSSKREVESCGIMTRETMDRILTSVQGDMEVGDSINFVFQGGEPMLANLGFFQEFVARVSKWNRGIKVSYALQTNGILLDDEWCHFLKEHRFLVGVSLDILPDCHDEVRVYPDGGGTYKAVSDAIHLLQKHQVDYNVLCTLTNAIARHPNQVWNRIMNSKVEYIQFTPCLGGLESSEQSPYALTPKRFASFYISLFNLWFEEFKKGNYRSIKFFDDCVNLMMYGRPTSCGMNGSCQPQLVVEADGSAYPCDFYCLDDYRLGNLTEQSPIELLQSEEMKSYLSRAHRLPELCQECPYRRFCGGNCKRMQQEICCGVTDRYCGYQDFLNHCGNSLQEIARIFRRSINCN